MQPLEDSLRAITAVGPWWVEWQIFLVTLGAQAPRAAPSRLSALLQPSLGRLQEPFLKEAQANHVHAKNITEVYSEGWCALPDDVHYLGAWHIL